MADSEQRRHPRIRRRFPVTLVVRGRSFSAVTEDLSQSGVLVRCAEILQPGTAISGSLELEQKTLSFGAMVRWSRSASRSHSNETQHSMGLAFLSTPGAAYLEYFERAVLEHTQAAALETPPTPARAKRSPTPVPEKSPKNPPPPRATPVDPVAGVGVRVPERVAASSPGPASAPKEPDNGRSTPLAGSALAPGLVGKVESVTKSTNTKVRGASPFAPSSAALLFERAAVQAVAGALPAGTQTLGLSFKLNMNRPPHVMIGARLEAIATLVSIAPDWTLRFQVELREGERVVASGEHQRVLVAG
jgi:predicted thioesterase